MSKVYKLLHDLPNAEAGTLFYMSGKGNRYLTKQNKSEDPVFTEKQVLNEDWFKLVDTGWVSSNDDVIGCFLKTKVTTNDCQSKSKFFILKNDIEYLFDKIDELNKKTDKLISEYEEDKLLSRKSEIWKGFTS